MVSGRGIPIRLDGLDSYNLLSILDRMEFPELLGLAETNKNFHFFIVEYVIKPRFRFHQKIITFDRLSSSAVQNELSEEAVWKIDSKRISIRHYETILRVLRVFGQFITKLEFIGFNFDENEAAEIYRRINEYCSNSLVDISIEPSSDLNTAWTKTFERVENVIIQRSSILEHWTIQNTFPNMRSLEIRMSRSDYHKLNDIQTLRMHFPHLEHLSLYIAMRNAEFPYLRDILVMNQQLKSLSLKNLINAETMIFINDALPNLETLDLISYPGDFLNSSEKIHFENVRHFALNVRGADFPKNLPISFNQLDAFHLRCHDLFDPFIDFITRTHSLRKIEFEAIQPNYEQLSEIVHVLDRLEELSAPIEEDMSGDGLSRFLRQKSQLKRITVSLMRTQKRTDLLKLVSSDWELAEEKFNEYTHTQQLTFERSLFSIH